MNSVATAIPVRHSPAPLEVRGVVHRLSRQFPSGRIEIIKPTVERRPWIVNVWIADVLAVRERVYPGVIVIAELALEVS